MRNDMDERKTTTRLFGLSSASRAVLQPSFATNLDLSMDQHASVELGDFDQDGDLDIATGEFERNIKMPNWINVYWNEGSVSEDPIQQQ